MSNQHDLATVELIVTRGLPASGKSTWARDYVDLQSSYGRRIVRFSRDDFRRMAFSSGYAKPDFQSEKLITAIRDAALEQWLTAGYSVILDDTNLRMRWAKDLADIAVRLGVKFRTVDFFDVPWETCVERDAERGRQGDVGFVGAFVIKEMHARFLASGNPGPVLPREKSWTASVEPYVPPEDGILEYVMCDLDGTLALLNGRSPYDESCVSSDLPNVPVIDVLQAMTGLGRWERFGRHDRLFEVVFMSARTEACREDTEAWLAKHVGLDCSEVELYMREVGDNRPDHVVKLELFNRYIRHHKNVRVVLDDRNSVVKLWRELGLTCLQVADGEF
jgi:predicted kinase